MTRVPLPVLPAGETDSDLHQATQLGGSALGPDPGSLAQCRQTWPLHDKSSLEEVWGFRVRVCAETGLSPAAASSQQSWTRRPPGTLSPTRPTGRQQSRGVRADGGPEANWCGGPEPAGLHVAPSGISEHLVLPLHVPTCPLSHTLHIDIHKVMQFVLTTF